MSCAVALLERCRADAVLGSGHTTHVDYRPRIGVLKDAGLAMRSMDSRPLQGSSSSAQAHRRIDLWAQGTWRPGAGQRCEPRWLRSASVLGMPSSLSPTRPLRASYAGAVAGSLRERPATRMPRGHTYGNSCEAIAWRCAPLGNQWKNPPERGTVQRDCVSLRTTE
jgi:hypothetical protein